MKKEGRTQAEMRLIELKLIQNYKNLILMGIITNFSKNIAYF